MNLTETYTTMCEQRQELQEEAIARQKWLRENECSFPSCHARENLRTCEAVDCIEKRCPRHINEFYGHKICERCQSDLCDFCQWLESIGQSFILPTYILERAGAILTYWVKLQEARNHIADSGESEKGRRTA
jgi:hypothetical protein